MKNIVKMSDLTNEEVFSLIKRGLELKNGKQVSPREDLYVSNLFFENSTSPDKKKRGWNTSRPLFSNLLLIWFLHLLRRFQKFQLSPWSHDHFHLVICQNQVFLLTIDFTAESLFQGRNSPNLCQVIACNGIHIIAFQLNIKYSLKSFRDMAPCTT